MKVRQTEPHIPLTGLAAVGARTLVMVGDDDLITPRARDRDVPRHSQR